MGRWEVFTPENVYEGSEYVLTPIKKRQFLSLKTIVEQLCKFRKFHIIKDQRLVSQTEDKIIF